MRLPACTLIIAIGLQSTACSAAVRASVCDLAAHQHRYRAAWVEVSGKVNGGLDRLLLSDRSCPSAVIAFVISNDVAKKPDVAPLWEAIYRQGNIGTVGKDIEATITGTVSAGKGGWPKVVLKVESVSALKVSFDTPPQGGGK
jgi:hypothetical protein